MIRLKGSFSLEFFLAPPQAGGKKRIDLSSIRVEDKEFMAKAIALAEKARGKTSPNPLVGAVVVKDGRIVGQGYHPKIGGPHAEVVALRKAGSRAKGATLYTTLEPCCTYGFTPPCTKAILKARVAEVVVGMIDPNPQVSTKGIKELRKGGLKVRVGFLEKEIACQNEAYIKHATVKKPFVLMKVAMSLDGKITSQSGKREPITSGLSLAQVHFTRSSFDAVMVGVGTILADNPLLTARLKGKEQNNPLRIIVDSYGRIPLEAKIVKTAKRVLTLLATSNRAPQAKLKKLQEKGLQIIVLPEREGKVDLKKLILELDRRGVVSLLLEGGAKLYTSAVEAGIVDKFLFFVAPKLIGGKNSLGVFGDNITKKVELKISKVSNLGPDLVIEAYPTKLSN